MPYIYLADLYCDSCGKDICRKLKTSVEVPANPDDQTSYDSDFYPKYVDRIGESDSPDHCACQNDCLEAEVLPSGAKIGKLLHTELTEEGVRYLKEIIAEGGEVAEFWQEEFADYLE
jgi:hypothetical protein